MFHAYEYDIFLCMKEREEDKMVEAVETLDGWYVLHDMRTFDWDKWQKASPSTREDALAEWELMSKGWHDLEMRNEGSTGLYELIGHKGDLLTIILRPSFDALLAVEKSINRSKMAAFFTQSGSYFSIVEIAKYRPNMDASMPEVKERLEPIIPRWDYVSFYPMSRRRIAEENWYTLAHNDRSKLLYEHSLTGRKYAGAIQQMISGSIGLDRYEWGVTLHAHDVLDLKKIVYEMRFDEVTAKYGEFADFYIGKYIKAEAFRHVFSV